MNKVSVKYKEFEYENNLYEKFLSSNDLSIIKSSKSNENSWLMALGRYLKAIRDNPNELLYEFLQELLNENLLTNRGLFLVLKQCVYLYPNKLTNLSFQRHLNKSLENLNDSYLQYKYVRLLRLILDEIDSKYFNEILPSTDLLIENYSILDSSLILVLEKFVLLKLDNQLQLKLNEIYHESFFEYLQLNDFDDDEIIDLCYILFQINLQQSFDCMFTNSEIFFDLFQYINYDIDTMMNWLLTPEIGEKFLIFLLRIMKYLSAHQDEFKSQYNEEKLLQTIKQFHNQLKTAHEKSLFPYNIKPLLNIFNLF